MIFRLTGNKKNQAFSLCQTWVFVSSSPSCARKCACTAGTWFLSLHGWPPSTHAHFHKEIQNFPVNYKSHILYTGANISKAWNHFLNWLFTFQAAGFSSIQHTMTIVTFWCDAATGPAEKYDLGSPVVSERHLRHQHETKKSDYSPAISIIVTLWQTEPGFFILLDHPAGVFWIGTPTLSVQWSHEMNEFSLSVNVTLNKADLERRCNLWYPWLEYCWPAFPITSLLHTVYWRDSNNTWKQINYSSELWRDHMETVRTVNGQLWPPWVVSML